MREHYEELTTCVSSPDNNINEKLQTTCRIIKEIAPNANRVSLWLFNQQANEIFLFNVLRRKRKVDEWSVTKKNRLSRILRLYLNK